MQITTDGATSWSMSSSTRHRTGILLIFVFIYPPHTNHHPYRNSTGTNAKFKKETIVSEKTIEGVYTDGQPWKKEIKFQKPGDIWTVPYAEAGTDQTALQTFLTNMQREQVIKDLKYSDSTYKFRADAHWDWWKWNVWTNNEPSNVKITDYQTFH